MWRIRISMRRFMRSAGRGSRWHSGSIHPAKAVPTHRASGQSSLFPEKRQAVGPRELPERMDGAFFPLAFLRLSMCFNEYARADRPAVDVCTIAVSAIR
jgi:hypothetical protein